VGSVNIGDSLRNVLQHVFNCRQVASLISSIPDPRRKRERLVCVVPGIAQGFSLLASRFRHLVASGDKRELRQTLIT
jgi:hypothetical protein